MPPKRTTSNSAVLKLKKQRIHDADEEEDEVFNCDDVVSEDEGSSRDSPVITRIKVKFGASENTLRDYVSHYFGNHDFSYLRLKPDHSSRPLWIDPYNGTIILESFSPLAEQAQDFLTTIAEPVSRPSFIHEYRLTPFSLYAAVSVGLEPKDIIQVLNRLSKSPLHEDLVKFIRDNTDTVGKVKLVLKHNQYFVESTSAQVLQQLLQDPVIGPLRVESEAGVTIAPKPTLGNLVIPGTKRVGEGKESAEDIFTAVVGIDRVDEEEEDPDAVHSFEISQESVEVVKKQSAEINFPMLEEYDFRNDERNPDLDIDLKPATQIRPYQEKSLSKMFGNGRARSGIIVLPCGAGKTLVGITAACTIKKSVLVLCTSSVSCLQWRQQFIQWSNIKPESISTFTSESKERFKGEAGIVISTYSMVANTRQRSHDSQKMMDFLQSREWGFLLLDEVHVVPAMMFRRVITSVATHAKLGLTATLVREDEKITDLNFLIGPKLYEANWMDLAQKGHIANVQCAEVWCPMTPEFYKEYLLEKSRKRMLLWIMNPRKIQACQFLIHYHENRGDKIIVFSDNVFALQHYARKLGKPFLYGGTSQAERVTVLENFQNNELVNTIFLSKIGDTSLDLPEATCLIQISSHYGSRRQEAQRLGRILRAKRRNDEGFNAFFYRMLIYCLVSKDTQEMFYSTKRQAFLVDQGYSFKVITSLTGLEELPNLAFNTPHDQRELLQEVLMQNESAADIDRGEVSFSVKKTGSGSSSSTPKYRRTAGSLMDLSGGADMVYAELNQSKNKALKTKDKKEHHPLFRNRAKKK